MSMVHKYEVKSKLYVYMISEVKNEMSVVQRFEIKCYIPKSNLLFIS
jgi:hypothetical protein